MSASDINYMKLNDDDYGDEEESFSFAHPAMNKSI